MMDMTNGYVRICADGTHQQNPDIHEKGLIEKLRERLQWTETTDRRGHGRLTNYVMSKLVVTQQEPV